MEQYIPYSLICDLFSRNLEPFTILILNKQAIFQNNSQSCTLNSTIKNCGPTSAKKKAYRAFIEFYYCAILLFRVLFIEWVINAYIFQRYSNTFAKVITAGNTDDSTYIQLERVGYIGNKHSPSPRVQNLGVRGLLSGPSPSRVFRFLGP